MEAVNLTRHIELPDNPKWEVVMRFTRSVFGRLRAFVTSVLNRFVELRFVVALGFIALYYLQRSLIPWLAENLPPEQNWGSLLQLARWTAFAVVLAILLIAFIANTFMWVADYKERLRAGVTFLLNAEAINTRDVLEHVRWTNAKILAVVAMILGLLSQLAKLDKAPVEHHVPLLALALLVLIALFDAALDLEAEWTISVLASARRSYLSRKTPKQTSLPAIIWATNQSKPAQMALYISAESSRAEAPDIKVASVSRTALNLISFAVVISACALVAMTSLVLRDHP